MQQAERLRRMPPYLFGELDRKRDEALQRGVDVISLGIGDPDCRTAEPVVRAMQQAVVVGAYHRYPSHIGLPLFREAVADYYHRRFGVSLDPGREVIACIGSKEGIAHLTWAYIEEGDAALVPDPAYPVYANQTRLAGGDCVTMPLRAQNGFLPRLEDVPTADAKRAKLIFANYPNNPTDAVADLSFFTELYAFARTYDLLVVSDAAYVESTYGADVAPSALQVPGMRERCVEFYSLSKPFNMTGWRIAAMVGEADAVAALAEMKSHTDSGQFSAIQAAGAAMLGGQPQAFIDSMNALYKARAEILVCGLRALGWQVPMPCATFYVWAPVPRQMTSVQFAATLLEEAGVLVIPGSGYGDAGEGYVRLCLTVSEDRLRQAVERLQPLAPRLFRA